MTADASWDKDSVTAGEWGGGVTADVGGDLSCFNQSKNGLLRIEKSAKCG